MSKRTSRVWEFAEKFVILKEIFTTSPVLAGLAWLIAMFGQSVPYISAFGLFGIIVTAVIAFLVFSVCLALQSVSKKKRSPQRMPQTPLQKVIQWRIWRWLIFTACLITGSFFLDLRPTLPSGISPSEISLPIASYRDMKETRIIGKTVILGQVPNARPMVIENKEFDSCLILGPAVVTGIGANHFWGNQFDTFTDPRDILLETKTPIRIGMIVLTDCTFKMCEIRYISFAGDSNFIAKILMQDTNNYTP